MSGTWHRLSDDMLAWPPQLYKLMGIVSKACRFGGQCDLSTDDLADLLGCSRGHVNRIVRAAVEAGLIISDPERGRRVLRLPEKADPGAQCAPAGRASAPAGRASAPAGRASAPAGRAMRAIINGRPSRNVQSMEDLRSSEIGQPARQRAALLDSKDRRNVNVSRSRGDGEPDHVAPATVPAEHPDPDPDDVGPTDDEVLARIAELEARPQLRGIDRLDLVRLRALAQERGLAEGQKAPGCPRTVSDVPTPVPEPVRPVAPAPRPPDPPRTACPDPIEGRNPDPEPSVDTETLLRRLTNPTFGAEVVDQVARRLASRLGDERSLGYYRRICEQVRRGELPPRTLLSAWKLARSPTATKPGAVFAATVRSVHRPPMRC